MAKKAKELKITYTGDQSGYIEALRNMAAAAIADNNPPAGPVEE